MIKRKIKITEDGSTTIELIEFNEHFHSIHGAIQESEHIYIQNGLRQVAKLQSSVKIFEMGFGSGLNAFLSLLFSIKNNINIDYLGIEAFPLEMELAKKLNYPEKLELFGTEYEYFNLLHSCSWNKMMDINANFSFEKQKIKLEDKILPIDYFDLVYFDAFNPELQP